MFRKIIIGCMAAGLLCTSCKNALETPLEFDVTMDLPQDMYDTNDITLPVGTQATFRFAGNADFISLAPEVFNETNATLSFDTKVSWVDNDQALQLYLSTDFAGLTGNAAADAQTIANHPWTDLSTLCSWPIARNSNDTSKIDLSEYKGRDVVLAFHYKPSSNVGFQPMFTISQMKLNSTVQKTGEISNTIAVNAMGWQPFDALNLVPDSMAYQSGSNAGMWDVSFSDTNDKTAFKIRQTAAGQDLNDDWLISKKIAIPRGKSTILKAINIKNIYLDVQQYTYTFTERGEYTLTFTGGNANYKQQEYRTKTFKINIVDK